MAINLGDKKEKITQATYRFTVFDTVPSPFLSVTFFSSSPKVEP